MGNTLKFLMLSVCILLVSCKKPAKVETNTGASKVIVLVGGLGSSQLGDVTKLVKGEYPLATVISFGGTDEWKMDLDSILKNVVCSDLIYIGHSYGTDTICRTKRKADTVILIDPVAQSGVKMRVPDGAIVYTRTFLLGPVRAELSGNYTLIKVSGTHNSIPHDSSLLESIKQDLIK